MYRLATSLLLVLLSGCDDGGATLPLLDAALDATPLLDAGADANSTAARDQAVDAIADMAIDAAPPQPTDYCEATVDVFCPFYMRCDRMAVPNLDACRAVFLENCNAVYEPVYAALADAGQLVLDPAGIARCAAHLETVECAAQIFDLDGPCGGIWVGQGQPEDACAPGIESFVCAPGNDCVLGLDFCGTCKPVAAIGAACDDENRCAQTARCVDGVCVERALPGMPCGETGCVLGARCVDDVCVGPARASVGESCASRERCPYRSACVGGQCVTAGLLGEPCGAMQPCASGACVGGICVAPSTPGSACMNGSTCIGGVCDGGQCAAIPGMCFAE